jgi:hypothetical protein
MRFRGGRTGRLCFFPPDMEYCSQTGDTEGSRAASAYIIMKIRDSGGAQGEEIGYE